MRNTITLSALLVLPLHNFVSSVPILLHTGSQQVDIWVTKYNTLNATTWNGAPHHPLALESRTLDGTVNEELSVDLTKPRNTRTAFQDLIARSSIRRSTRARSRITNLHSTNGSLQVAHWTKTTLGANLGLRLPTKLTSSILNVNGISLNDKSSRITRLNSAAAASAGILSISLVNNLPSSNVKVYISGLDTNGALIMLGQSGAWVYPTTASTTPQAVGVDVALSLGAPNSTTTFMLPSYIESARVWVADGGLQFYVVATPTGPGLVEPAAANANDPNSEVNYAFAELSWSAQSGLYADITAVDFVGLPLGIELVESNGTVASVFGLPSNAASTLCSQLIAQSEVDGKPWNQLCAYASGGDLVRVLAPNNFLSSQPNAFGRYFSRYVNDAWNYYRRNDLIINTQTSAGNVTCRVQGDTLQCAGDNRGYAKPNNYDIFGCNTGPFAILQGDNAVHYAVVPRLCAAFNRATLLVPGGNVQPGLPPSQYYDDDNRPENSRPKNWYSQLVHEIELEGRGYAFSYDDVSPSVADDQSGLLSSLSPRGLRILIGGT